MKLGKKIYSKVVYISIVALSIFCLVGTNVCAQTNYNSVFENANLQYSKGNYEKAIELYESILKNNIEAGALYFNLGNAYYKTNRIGLAVLNYEKAKKLLPDDEDIETNLRLSNLKTEDKIDGSPNLFIVDWINSVTGLMSEKSWSVICILIVCISLLFFIFYFLSVNLLAKKTFFYTALCSAIIAISFFFFAQHKYSQIKNSNEAIIISPVTTINSSPAEKSTKLFILHEGAKFTITDEDNEWVEIKLANGNVGWAPKKDIQKI